jgi:hypothetical protein
MKTIWFAFSLMVVTLIGCTMNTTKTDTAKQALTKSATPGTYSLYGKGIQRDDESGLMYINVYVGGGGDRDGALRFATDAIEKYSKANGFSSYEVVKSEYSLFPLSKYTFYLSYK